MRNRLIVVLLLTGCVACAGSRMSASRMVKTVESFRAARDAEDYEQARRYLADDALLWYEELSGDGLPIVLGDGPYKEWDSHFRSEFSLGAWQIGDSTLWAVAVEWNDYYRLLERTDTSRYRITYYFDDAGLISGYLISAAGVEGLTPPREDRFAEFAAWAQEHHFTEWEYLRPGGTFDPAGDRALRTRTLLNAWRETVGLEPIW